MIAYTIVGKSLQGNFQGEWVIVSNLRHNALMFSTSAAQAYMDEIKLFLDSRERKEIDPVTLQIAKIEWEMATDRVLYLHQTSE